ncbi:hypothetical protein GQ53DRAFT_819983 [Thozetella sp. PMI_491]|nr:hypothetical protein GQ53DRAFT_819983 [Thozetella sp. PMI_491]
MASPSTAHARWLYRSLLKELPARSVLATPRAPLHQRLRDHFHSTPKVAYAGLAHAAAPPEHKAAAQAVQFVAYLRAQRTYVQLIEQYNPGMGMDEEERVRLTARRVGMDLPVEFGSESSGGSKK